MAQPGEATVTEIVQEYAAQLTGYKARDQMTLESLAARLRVRWEQDAKPQAPPTPEAMRDALERIALLDEADGHELTAQHAMKAVGIATNCLGKHPSQIFFEREGRS